MANDKSTATWKSAEREKAVIEDEGDILLPLKRVREQYIRRAEELDGKACGENRANIKEVAQCYRKAAYAVGLLIDATVDISDLVEKCAPVDQTELIISDIEETLAWRERNAF